MKRMSIYMAAILVVLQLCSSLWALPTTAYDAEMVVTGWLKADPKPLGSNLGRQIVSVETITNDLGEPVYYVVYLQPSGFVIVSADDLVEPIIAFSGNGTYDPSSVSPLKSLLTEDIKTRTAAVRNTFVPLTVASQVSVSETQKKWDYLIGLAGVSGDGYKLMAIDPILDDNLSDIRVPPLAQSKWGQSNYYDSNDQPWACYNYCTPQLINNRGSFVEGHVDNYPVGCVAVAVAQFVLSQRYPQEPIGPKEFTISIEGQKADCSLLGGDGPGGAYNWDEMVLVPDDETTVQQRRTIGALCFDAAIAVDTEFGRDGSGASLDNAVKALLETFEYDNAVWAEGEGGHVTRKHFLSLFNPNLDAGIPVILGFRNSDYPWYGHAAICDGYGYNLSKLYHHLNMGWEGQEDCWYSLPDIAYPDMVPFDAINQCVYNIFTDGTGEIISGRIVDSNGVPFEGITVTAQSETDPDVHTAVTNDNGIYAFIGLDSDTAYTIVPDMLGYDFDLSFGYGPEGNIVTTGRSGGNSFVTGNIWGVDFIGYSNSDPNSTGQESQVVCADVKLTASDGARNDHFGSVVAMSGDYAIVGAYGDDDGRGAAYIFKREGTSWVEQVKLRKPGFRQADDYFGYSVAISGDYAIVGAYEVDGRRGDAYIFERNGTSWALQADLQPSESSQNDYFGKSVSISGHYAIVGSAHDDLDTETYRNRNFGSVYMFEWDGISWTKQAKLYASDGEEDTYFGNLVSISGNYAIVTTVISGSYGSPIYILKHDGTSWAEQAKLMPPNGLVMDAFGRSISISGDYAVIGALLDDLDDQSDAGSVYVFKRDDTSWSEQAKLTSLDSESFDHFGSSVSINAECIIIGAPDDDDHYMGRDSGSAYVFELDGTEWKQRAKLTALDAQYDDFFGTSVAIDGDYAIVGAPGDDDKGRESGSVYVFKHIGSVWTPSGNIWGVDLDRNSDPNSAGQESQGGYADVKLTASDGARDDHFGSAIAISGDYVIVGAYGDDDNRGAAYMFKREGTSWIEQAKLRKPGFRQTDDYFGHSVDINGDFAIVGAYGSDMRRGAAYVFKRDGISWTQRTELWSVNMATYDSFGYTVSISGNYAIVGSPGDDSDTLTSAHRDWGSVCIFELDGETWIQQEKLFASDGSKGARFGAVVSICGDYAIVSSGYYYPSPNHSYGPVYIMKRDGITWTEQVILSSLESSFGNSVSIGEAYAVIGAPDENNDNGDGSGSVYVYIHDDAGWEQQIVLTASDGEPFDSFGRSLSINGNHIIIGAPDDDDHDMGRDSGSAYVFELDGTEWKQRAKLTALDAQYDDFLGTSVAIDGDYAIVGAPGDDDNGRESGSVYVFKRIGSLWTP